MFGVVIESPHIPGQGYYVLFVDSSAPCYLIEKRSVGNVRSMTAAEKKAVHKASKETELSIGDWVCFDAQTLANFVIVDYEKTAPLCDFRFVNAVTQIEAICVFSPLELGEAYGELLGSFKVDDAHIAERFLTDVALRLWVSMRCSNRDIQVQFAEFVEALDDTNSVSQSPWNQSLPCDIPVHNQHNDVDCGIPDMMSLTFSAQNITDSLGVIIDGPSIFWSDGPHEQISFPYIDGELKSKVGSRVKFSAFFSSFCNCYVVLSYQIVEMPIDIRRVENGILYRTTVEWTKDLPSGYLLSKDNVFGLVHDSDFLLTALFTKRIHNVEVKVALTDRGRDALTRFAVKNVYHDSNGIDWQNYRISIPRDTHGIYLGNRNVLALEYETLKIYFDEAERRCQDLVVGQHMKFSASAVGNYSKEFKIFDWYPDSPNRNSPIPFRNFGDRYVFLASVKFELKFRVFVSHVFGFIGINDDGILAKLVKCKRSDPLKIWIYEAVGMRTRFVFHSYNSGQHFQSEIAERRVLSDANRELIRTYMNDRNFLKYLVETKRCDLLRKLLYEVCDTEIL